MRPWTAGNRLLGWDRELRRLWVGGQRLHHGVTGLAFSAAGLTHLLVTRRPDPSRAIAWTLAGATLIAHDWKDRAVWFKRGHQAD
jgi:hypothetical protein